MEKAGLETQVDFMGRINGPEMESSQADEWRAMAAECGESTGFAAPQLSDSQIAELYQQEVKTHECLIGAGQDTGTPPSEEVYRQTWGGQEQYYAFYEIWMSTPTEEGLKTISKTCMPPTWFLNLEGLGD